MTISELEKTANQIRRDIVNTNYTASTITYPAPSLSCTDIVTALYFNIMNIDPQNPKWEDRDRFIMSKGHAYMAYYSAIARREYFSADKLPTVRAINSMHQGHPNMKKIPGVDMTADSLGNGLSAGAGMALYAKAKKKKYKVYVIIGDGESQEGAILEAAKNTGAIVTVEDNNILGGLGGAVAEVLSENCPVLMKRIGINDCYAESGEESELLDKYGISVSAIVNTAENLIKRK